MGLLANIAMGAAPAASEALSQSWEEKAKAAREAGARAHAEYLERMKSGLRREESVLEQRLRMQGDEHEYGLKEESNVAAHRRGESAKDKQLVRDKEFEEYKSGLPAKPSRSAWQSDLEVIQKELGVGFGEAVKIRRQAVTDRAGAITRMAQETIKSQAERDIRPGDPGYLSEDEIFREAELRVDRLLDIPDQTSSGIGGVPTPQTQEEYDAIPSGAEFRDPDDGKLYRKP